MKKILFLLIVISFISCSKNDEPLFFELSKSNLNFNKPQQSAQLHISSNTDWSTYDVPSWVTLSQGALRGSLDITITVSQNNDQNGQTRVGTIKFLADNKTYILTIVQTADIVPLISIVNNVVYHLDYRQQVFTIQINSTLPWQLVQPSTWIQVSPSSGNAGITSVQVTVSEFISTPIRAESLNFTTQTPLNYNNGSIVSLDIDQINDPLNPLYPLNPILDKTWNQTNILNGTSDIRYNVELKNNKYNNSVFLTYNTILIGSKAYFEVFDGVNWSRIPNSLYLYCDYPRLAISQTGIPFVSYKTGGLGQLPGYASAQKVSDINHPAMQEYLSPSTVNNVDIALNNNNEMVIAYGDNNNRQKITVRQKIGTSWQDIGQEGFSAGAAKYCNVVVNTNNEIYVAYADSSLSNRIVVKKFDGFSWITIGSLGFSVSGAELIEMEIGTNNDLYVAYKDAGYGNKITVKKLVFGNWQTVGTEGFSNYSIGSVSLALDNQNQPYVAYIESGNGDKPVIKKYDGSSWMDLKPIRVTYGEAAVTSATELKIIIGTDNKPFIALKRKNNIGRDGVVILAKYLF